MLSVDEEISGLSRELLQVLAVGLLIGLLGGLAANFFVLGVGFVDGFIFKGALEDSSLEALLLSWFVLLSAGMLILFVKRAFALERWYGPADTILFVHRPGMAFRIKEGFLSSLAAFISASAGASVGQYGPVLHFGASVGAYVKRFFASRIGPEVFVACGVAAAISAGFGAPIAGVIFASEAILRHFAVRALAPISISAITAAAITPLFFERSTPYLVRSGSLDWSYLPILLALGLCSAVLSIVFMRSLITIQAWVKACKAELGMILAAASLMALIGSAVPEASGLGTDSVNALLSGEKTVWRAALMLLAKLFATVLCLGLGFFGGVFSPALFMGASLGYLFGALAVVFGFPTSSAAIFTVAGIAAVTGSVVGAPVAMVLIVLEFTGSYEFALAAIIAVAMSSFVSTRLFSYSFFDFQLMKRGVDLRQGREVLSLRDVHVSSLELTQGVCISEEASGEEIVEALKAANKTEAYVVDLNKKLVGRTTIVDVLNHGTLKASQFMERDYAVLCENDDLATALLVARDFVGEAIPITDNSGALIGCISEGDILSGTMDWQEQVKGYERN